MLFCFRWLGEQFKVPTTIDLSMSCAMEATEDGVRGINEVASQLNT